MTVKQAIAARRAYRSLAPAPVGRDVVRQLAEAASLCCSAENHQPWRFVFVTAPKLLQRLYPALTDDNAWARNASMLIAVCTRENLDDTVDDRDIAPYVTGAGRLSRRGNKRPYYLYDTGMATAFLILRATEMGLVAHPIAGYLEQRVQEVLGIPTDVTVMALVVVGRRAAAIDPSLPADMKRDEKTRPRRLPIGAIVAMNRFSRRELSSPAVRRILRRK